MNIRDQLARVIARDSRYPLEAYAFVLEALSLARNRKLKDLRKKAGGRTQGRGRPKRTPRAEGAGTPPSGHVTGQEVCHAARRLALRTYGAMAIPVLTHWGLRSTSDIGEIVYNLIASGDLTKTPEDKRTDFDDVYRFEVALRPKSLLPRETSN